MAYCIRCAQMSCGEGEGLISVHWNTSSSARPIGGACAAGGGSDPQFVPGPVTGSVNIQAYAFSAETGKRSNEGNADLWMGSKCIARATAQQNNLLKYNGNTDEYLLIPTTINSATMAGDTDKISVLTMETMCQTESFQLSLAAGSVTIGTKLGTDIGHSLKYTGGPYGAEFPDTGAKTVFGISNCYISGFSFNTEYPNTPAQVTYTYQFVLDCGD